MCGFGGGGGVALAVRLLSGDNITLFLLTYESIPFVVKIISGTFFVNFPSFHKYFITAFVCHP